MKVVTFFSLLISACSAGNDNSASQTSENSSHEASAGAANGPEEDLRTNLPRDISDLVESRLSDNYWECIEPLEPYSRAEKAPDWVSCQIDEAKVQDVRLNIAYKSLMSRLPQEERTGLRASQRRWLETIGETTSPDNCWKTTPGNLAAVTACELQRITERTIWLENYY